MYFAKTGYNGEFYYMLRDPEDVLVSEDDALCHTMV